jgi:hypothetical protein
MVPGATMPPWATVTITLGAAAIAVAGTLLGTWFQLRHARRQREETAQADLLVRAAAVLGPVRTLLTDLDPDRIAFNINGESPQRLRDLEQRWMPLRDALSTFAASASNPRVTNAGAKLEVAVSNTFHRLSWALSELLDPGGERPSAMLEQGRREHLRATILTRALLDTVRGEDVTALLAQADDAD